MGRGLHYVLGALLIYFAAEGTDTINILPDGFLEYLILLAGVLMILVPARSKTEEMASKLQGVPGPKMLGLPVRIWFIIFGIIVVLISLTSLVGLGTVFGWIGLGSFGSLFDVLSVYTLTGRWILVGIGVIYLLSVSKRGNAVIPL